MKPVYVQGLGLWTPGYPDPHSWCRRERDPDATAASAGLLTGPLRRRATALTRMAVGAMQQAAEQAACDPVETASIWATAHGEHTTALEILEMMRCGEGKLSPTRFHNSVHNSASGYASIATGNTAPSTTLTGGSELVVSALLESQCLVEASGRDVLLVLADEPLQCPFERSEKAAALAMAFCLSPREAGALAQLGELRRDHLAPARPHESFAGLHIATALCLLEQIVLARSGAVALELQADTDGPVACIDVACRAPLSRLADPQEVGCA